MSKKILIFGVVFHALLFCILLFMRSNKEISRLENLPDIEQVFQETSWDNLSIDFCPAQDKEGQGYTSMKLKNASALLKDSIYHVSSSCPIGIKNIRNINISYNPVLGTILDVMLSQEGKEKLKNYTSNHIGEILAIVIDEQLVSAPRIMEVIESGRIQIAGVSATEADSIAKRFFIPLKSIVPYLQ